MLVGTSILLCVWAVSFIWLPEGFFLFLPRPTIASCQQDTAQTVRVFAWNLILTGGLTVFASLFAVNRFPFGYVVPWVLFAVYGGMIGTNSFACPNHEGPLPVSVSVLWTRAGFREVMGYGLISAAFADQYLWNQPSFFKVQVERIRSWKELKMNTETVFGLFIAILLIA